MSWMGYVVGDRSVGFYVMLVAALVLAVVWWIALDLPTDGGHWK